MAPLPDMRGSIVKRTVKEQISEKLASHIVSGILQVGDELPGERELAAAFAVSRESVRSAIQDLASRGLVEVSQGARTRVVSAEGAARQPGLAAAGSYKDHTEIMAGLRARDPAGVVAAFDRHLERIYTTTHAILDAMGRHRPAGESDGTPQG